MRIRIRNFFDPGSGMEKFGSGIRDPGSATLLISLGKFMYILSFHQNVSVITLLSCATKRIPSPEI
jgi:hypothetical protein